MMIKGSSFGLLVLKNLCPMRLLLGRKLSRKFATKFICSLFPRLYLVFLQYTRRWLILVFQRCSIFLSITVNVKIKISLAFN